jgi:hypothetical protein
VYVLRCNAFIIVAGIAVLIPVPAAGQGWRPTARVQTEVRADDNPFLLDADHKGRLANPSAGDQANGRYRDMESATDIIAIPSIQFRGKGDGLGGRTLAISADAAYELNVHNQARRHAELRFEVEQRVRKGGDVRFTADWRPSYFHKNYLEDAVDLNTDANISSAERIYTRATSRDLDLALQYRQQINTVSAAFSAGYLNRRYAAPFDVRSRRGPGFRGDLALQASPAVTLGVGYSLASLAGDPGTAVLILDESEFGVDFNGNLTTTDSSARAAVLVDYSRLEQQLGASITTQAGVVTVALEYDRRTRDFSSTQPYDVANRDRHDVLNEFTLAGEVEMGAAARLAAGYRRGSQTTNRPADPGSTGDASDYTRTMAWLGVRYRF